MTRINLPFPPSSNNMFVNAKGKGRIKSKEYDAWRQHALLMINSQKIKPIKGEVSISIGLVKQTYHRQDCTNRIKAVEDCLVEAGIIQNDDDRYVRRVSVEWLAHGDPCSVLIQPVEHA